MSVILGNEVTGRIQAQQSPLLLAHAGWQLMRSDMELQVHRAGLWLGWSGRSKRSNRQL
jgi:hypothetical protein